MTHLYNQPIFFKKESPHVLRAQTMEYIENCKQNIQAFPIVLYVKAVKLERES
jgi:hypothetical protein